MLFICYRLLNIYVKCLLICCTAVCVDLYLCVSENWEGFDVHARIDHVWTSVFQRGFCHCIYVQNNVYVTPTRCTYILSIYLSHQPDQVA